MNFENIKELIKLVNDSELTTFECNLDQAYVKMGKNKVETVAEEPSVSAVQPSVQAEEKKIMSSFAEEKTEEEQKEVDLSSGYVVKSPIVGTFYSSAGPNKPEFVKKGDRVKVGDVLCIVEAMKVMNEIVSDYDGEIANILVKNEELVEFGQPLFHIV